MGQHHAVQKENRPVKRTGADRVLVETIATQVMAPRRAFANCHHKQRELSWRRRDLAELSEDRVVERFLALYRKLCSD